MTPYCVGLDTVHYSGSKRQLPSILQTGRDAPYARLYAAMQPIVQADVIVAGFMQATVPGVGRARTACLTSASAAWRAASTISSVRFPCEGHPLCQAASNQILR